MFSSQHRLRNEIDVMRVVRSKRGVFDAALGIKYVPNTLGIPRFAIVVSTKVSKRAVVRNKIRRQCREVCKKNIPHMGGFDIAILVSRPALAFSFLEITERLEHNFRKAGIISRV